jgi:hypothetical protein
MPAKYKSVALAIILSILYPGLGHYYAGVYITGLIWSVIAFINQWVIYSCYRSPLGFMEAGGWTYILIYAVIILASAIRAFVLTVKQNQYLEHLDKEKQEKKHKGQSYDILKNRWK